MSRTAFGTTSSRLLKGLIVDPVYTGNALAGLFGMVRSGELGWHETVVFIHTGGTGRSAFRQGFARWHGQQS
jgi:1-aminocyclopropane-1-carboxylate deaminase/D-cysteine desulfhydrase-like pyridoxal-dependent ACC family enzyme